MTAKIKMTKTARGSLDGVQVQRFESGQVYDVNAALKKAFVDDLHVAELISETVEQKSLQPDYENKSLEGAPKKAERPKRDSKPKEEKPETGKLDSERSDDEPRSVLDYIEGDPRRD